MERGRDSRKPTLAAGCSLRRRLQRIASSGGELHVKARLGDREKSEHRRGRDCRNLKRTLADRSNEKYKENKSGECTDRDEQDEGRGVHRTNQRGTRTLRSSLAVRSPADEVIGAVVPRRSRSCLVRRVDAESSSGFGQELRSSPAMASVSNVGGNFLASSAKKMKCSAEKRISSTISDDIEMEVAEALFDLMQQKIGRETANSDDMKISGQAESVKDEAIAFSLENQQSVSVETKIAVESSEEKLNVGGELPSFPKAEAGSYLEPSKHVAADAQNEEKPLGKAEDMSPNDMSATSLCDPPVANQLKKEKGDAVSSNQSISNVMSQSRLNLSSGKSTQRQNLMEQRNHSSSSFSPLPSGIHGLSGVLPYTGHSPPPLQVLARPSMEFPLFKFSEPRDKRCATHQNIARNIRSHKQMVEECMNRGPSVSAAASLYGNHLSSLNKPWFGGTSQGGQFLPSENDKNAAAAAAFTNSKSSHVLNPRKNPRETQSDSFLRGPGFIFPFGGHQVTGNSNETSVASLGFNSATFASNKAPPPSYMAVLQSSGSSVPIAAANNTAVPPLRGQQLLPSMQVFGSSSPFNFSQSHFQQSSQRQPPPQSSKPTATTTSKSPQASATGPPPQQPMQLLSKTSTAGHQFPHGLLPVQLMNFPVQLFTSSQSSTAAAAVQWQQQQQQLFHQVQAKKHMARDKDLTSSNCASNNKRQNPENFPPAKAASQSGGSVPLATKETTEATAASPLCRRDVAATILGNAQHFEPKC